MRKFSDIKSRNELADFLNVPRSVLSYVLYVKGISNLYSSFEIPKKSGGIRKINAPMEDLKDIQKKLAEALYDHTENKWVKNDISHAFRANKGIISNAEVHRNKKLVLNVDLENFFESFHFGRVRGFFNKNKDFLLPIEVATVIAQISCYEGKLPQGAPCSPIITNLICEILDFRILKIAKKYKLNYTRYADDLTFSTNDKNFIHQQEKFYQVLSKELTRAGFIINTKKTRLQLKDSRQVVTGLVVNKKLNVKRDYYKETRAMAHHLYKHGFFLIDGQLGTLNQLEGRFAFINQLTKYNNKKNGHMINGKRINYNDFGNREREYQKFLFYKYFFANPRPLIVTEGKTDVVYIKSALKNLYREYPGLITKNDNGTFDFKFSFLKKTKRLSYFLGIYDGGNALNNIFKIFSASKDSKLNHLSFLKEMSKSMPKNPVILMFDNEGKGKPLAQFLQRTQLNSEEKKRIREEYKFNLVENLYLLTCPLIDGQEESEIEDLFDEFTLSHTIEGKKFTKSNEFDESKFYGKQVFSDYILHNYNNINFDGFRPLLNEINSIIESYRVEAGMQLEAENKNSDKYEKAVIGN